MNRWTYSRNCLLGVSVCEGSGVILKYGGESLDQSLFVDTQVETGAFTVCLCKQTRDTSDALMFLWDERRLSGFIFGDVSKRSVTEETVPCSSLKFRGWLLNWSLIWSHCLLPYVCVGVWGGGDKEGNHTPHQIQHMSCHYHTHVGVWSWRSPRKHNTFSVALKVRPLRPARVRLRVFLLTFRSSPSLTADTSLRALKPTENRMNAFKRILWRWNNNSKDVRLAWCSSSTTNETFGKNMPRFLPNSFRIRAWNPSF